MELFGKYPYLGSVVVMWSHHFFQFVIEPVTVKSSTYQTCLVFEWHSQSSLMSGVMTRECIAIASGSPWVVQQSSFNILITKGEPHSMNRYLTSSHLACTHLQGAIHLLYVVGRIHTMAFEMICRGTSPMPIGLTPGRLSNGIRCGATNTL